jgi:hypothetical protein
LIDIGGQGYSTASARPDRDKEGTTTHIPVIVISLLFSDMGLLGCPEGAQREWDSDPGWLVSPCTGTPRRSPALIE